MGKKIQYHFSVVYEALMGRWGRKVVFASQIEFVTFFQWTQRFASSNWKGAFSIWITNNSAKTEFSKFLVDISYFFFFSCNAFSPFLCSLSRLLLPRPNLQRQFAFLKPFLHYMQSTIWNKSEFARLRTA